jgi:3-oxoacyl-[acyl-carrier protein] reductase
MAMSGGRLAGKVAIVTGASRGIGAATAKLFGAEGAKVVVNYNGSEKSAARVLGAVTSGGGEAIAVRADVTDSQQVSGMVSRTLEQFGAIDVLVNNAGIIVRRPFLEATEADFDRLVAVNLKGAYLCCKEVIPKMLERGSGNVINVSSVSGLAQSSALANPDYSMTKAGLIGLTRALAVNLGPKVRVNAICPGTIETDMLSAMPQQRKDYARDEAPLKRLGKPEDVARAALFLASDESDFITGEIITVSGGRGMR